MDLRAGGLLDETPVIWGGQFGRTSHGRNSDGRDHNNKDFKSVLCQEQRE
jgi:hypothetical protein